ncbi:MAG: class I SAM-dependent methyltransferase [Actinomycetota bacterium]|nr:class I SAM-dependent methyltransferase [Actinomycetota bacterium]
MAERSIRQDAAGWVGILRDLGLKWGEATLVMGEGAELLAESYQRAGSPPVAHQRPGYLVLARERQGDRLDQVGPLATGLANDSLDLVVMRHAVPKQAMLARALREAYRVLKPGGGVLVSDVDVNAMIDSTTHRYPSRLQYTVVPDVLPLEMARHVASADLSVEVVRASFKDVDAYDVDQEFGEFDDPDAYWEFVRERGWRSFDLMTEAQVEMVLSTLRRLLPRLASTRGLVEREPWHVTRGFKPPG